MHPTDGAVASLFCPSRTVPNSRGLQSARKLTTHKLSHATILRNHPLDSRKTQYLFRPAVKQLSKLSFKGITALAGDFDTSLTSTAIRVVESNQWPAMLVCHGQTGRRWFTRAPIVPERWFPQEALDADSYAIDVLYGRKPDNIHPRKIGGEAWFDRREAERYEILEQSVRIGSAEVLTLISFTDEEMLEERERWGR